MKKYENFCYAFNNLKDIYDYEEPFGNVELTGMVDDEELWLAALVSRNNVAHAYNKDVALDIIYATKEKYYHMFEILKKKLEENWI